MPQSGRILQVFRPDSPGSAAAKAFRTALAGYGITNLQDRIIPASRQLTAEFWSGLSEAGDLSQLVLWLGISDLEDLGPPDAKGGVGLPEIYLSARLLPQDPDALSAELRAMAYMIDPFVPPETRHRQLLRFTVWARARQLPVVDERVMGNAYFAAMTTADAIRHIRGNLTREYFIERIEHMVDNALFHSVYPHLSLGPDQRFASKGCYITGPSPGESASPPGAPREWIVPD
jgi:hypothetical protein